ncbi:hypothetical protein H7J88_24625 [Mycolicibacterium flavescens]|uniref:PE-PPE domain-containing protein n=1 Tax=Mycolicibacterium flavescens TaxID=1776 RepID=A0A1E3RFV3_MYCFV|nr:hypothetical protein [Mycolicibacterium flavescens]MCV7282825.1 hypothetical protein [Mycolicibacterium flavescens]ODQ88733.1 hypothetical protein BHQ18_17900 [Mycolicibacterium flavescens]
MNAFARPLPTRLAAAIVAAGVVSTGAAVVEESDHRISQTITAEVAPASIVTEMLYNFGTIVSGAAGAYAAVADAQTSLPFDFGTAALIALENPTLGPSLFSWFVQRYLNPSDGYPPYTYAWDLKSSIQSIASTFPPPIGGAIITGLNQFADAIGAAFADLLPDPSAGIGATTYFWDSTPIGQTVWAANLAAVAPIYVVTNVISNLAYLPATLEATFESALRDPSQILNNLSYLAHGLLGPGGLLGGVVDPIVAPFIALPGPIGDFSQQLVDAFYGGVDALLGLLPPPIPPTPFGAPSMFASSVESQEEAGDAEVADNEFSALRSVPADDTTDEGQGSVDEGSEPSEPAKEDEDADADSGDKVVPVPGAPKVKQGNKFVPGGGDAPVDGDTTGSPDEVQAPADAPAPSDEGADDADDADQDANEPGGEAA